MGWALAARPFRSCNSSYYGAPLRIALETASSLIALFACFLVYGRLRRCAGSPELLLGCALAMLALVNLCLLVVPLGPLSPVQANELLGWVLLTGRLLAGCFSPGLHRPAAPSAAAQPGAVRVRRRQRCCCPACADPPG